MKSTGGREAPLLEATSDKLRKAAGKAEVSKLLLRYILGVATLAFTGRAAPLAFLPLVLKTSFAQEERVIGVVMAIYPFFALVATPWAARLSRNTTRIVTLHSVAIIVVASAMFLTAAAETVQSHFGNTAGVLWVALGRAAQGIGASLYLSSNTSLITRRFPDRLPYVIAMTEVAVGSGGQLGRICGGFLFQFGGFMCPFVVIGVLQALVGFLGFGFEDAPPRKAPAVSDASKVETRAPSKEPATESQKSSKIPMSTLLTPRLCAGALGAFMMYFCGCFADATLLQYLMVHLAPVTVGDLGVAMSVRGMTYLISSFFIAQVMHGELVSFERLLSFGAIFGIVGLIFMAPQNFVTDAEAWFWPGRPSKTVLWSTLLFSFVAESVGRALMFVPSLPLMQSEVKVHGNAAVEQIAELFVTMMTLGEMLGPIFGGWLVGEIGFVDGTLILSATLIPLCVLSLASIDRKAQRARRGKRGKEVVLSSLDPEDDSVSCGRCGPGLAFVPSDGEASFAYRRIPFALEAQREQDDAPGSAPSSVFRRMYSPPERGDGEASATKPRSSSMCA